MKRHSKIVSGGFEVLFSLIDRTTPAPKLRALLWALSAILCGVSSVASAQTKAATTSSLAVTSSGSSVTSVASGSIVSLTATVMSGSKAVSPGRVLFCDASATYCSDVHMMGSAQLRTDGTATWRFRPGPGTHKYKVVFAGSNALAASSSAAATLSVTVASGHSPATVFLSNAGSWGDYSLGATVQEIGGTAPLSGGVSFVDTSYSNALLATMPLGASTPGLTWAAQNPLSTPMNPSSVIVADFNNDGIPDIATADIPSQKISVFASQADGTYQQTFTVTDTFSPYSITVGDFNSDGNLDIAVPNASGSENVKILLGHGDGTFTVSTATAANVNTALAVADFNGDGIPDLAVANLFGSSLVILTGKGDGTFTASPGISLANTPLDLAAGDFNGDGKIDLAVATNVGLSMFTGNGDGTFTAGTAVTVPGNGFIERVKAADFNADGKLDLVVSTGTNVTPSTGQVMIFLGKGDATFNISTPVSVSESPSQLEIADFNLDGIPDVGAMTLAGEINVLIGHGDGTFSSQFIAAVSQFARSFAIGDMDGDGRTDLVGFGPGSSNTTVLDFLLTRPTETASTAAAPVTISGIGQHLVVADYAGDANSTPATSNALSLWGVPPASTTTLAITAGGSQVTSVAANTVVTLTASAAVSATPLTAGTVSFCDANSSSCTGAGLVGSAALTSNGKAVFKFVPGPGLHNYKAVLQQNAYGLTSSSSAHSLTVGSFAHVQAATTSTIAQTGGSISNYTLTATVTGTGSTTPLTGKVSFLDTNYSNSVVASAQLGTSSAGLAFPITYTYTASSGADMLAVQGDFNGDGRTDIAAMNAGAMSVSILLSKGDGTFSTAPSIATSNYPSAIATGDFNHDGKLDIAIAAPQTVMSPPGQLLIYLGNGDGTFTAAPSPQTLTASANTLFVADLNGDGKLDAIVGSQSNTQVMLGNGDGTFASPTTFGSSGAVAVADFNGDGVPDMLLGYSYKAPTVYLGKGDGTFETNGLVLSSTLSAGSAAVGDFNGDGNPDVAIVPLFYSPVSIFLGKGDGTFTSVDSSANFSINEPLAIAVADLNSDGKADLIITNVNSGSPNAMDPDLVFMLGNGDGTFTGITGDTQINGTWGVVAADFNGDGRPDLAVGTNQGISVLLTEPTETATATVTGVNPPGPAPHNVNASYPGDSNYNGSVSGTLLLDVEVAKPVLTPASGIYTSSQTVKISDTTPGATIYYTMSQSYPIQWTVYTGPITIDTEGSYTVQAYATANGYQQSQQASETYTLNLPRAVAPVITPGTGSFAGPQTVTISDASNGARIYYTLDGSLPTPQSTLYKGPLTVSTSTVVSAIASGGGYGSSSYVFAQILINSSSSSFIYTVAGNQNSGYSGDGGAATVASLNGPVYVVLDSAGNLYIADEGNCVVRKTDAKTGKISTFAGNGSCGYSGDNGAATQAQLDQPAGLAIDRNGNVYISDHWNGVVRKVSTSGIITTFAGSSKATAPGDGGPATSAQIQYPIGLAFDSAGNLYIASSYRVRMVAANSGTISTVAGNGNYGYTGDGGLATSATIEFPTAIAFDGTGNFYFADFGTNVVRKVTKSGTISTVAGKNPLGLNPGTGDGGPATSAVLSSPYGLAVDGAGNLFIADTFDSEIREVTASDGVIHRFIGSVGSCTSMSGDGGPATSAGICTPYGITIDAGGNFYIAEAGTSRVRKVTAAAFPPTAKTAAPAFAAQPGTYGAPQLVDITSSTPGAAIYVTLNGSDPETFGAQFRGPLNVTGPVTIKALAVAPGYLSSDPVTASYNITSTPPAIIATVAGAGSGTVTDGGLATSEYFGFITGVAVDASGNLYIPDAGHAVVWKVTASTGKANVVAGTLNQPGELGDNGPATSAQLSGPSHVALAPNGDLFISEAYAGTIRKVSSSGIITTYAGGGAYGSLGDGGPATSAQLQNPGGIAFDKSGALYIADSYARRVRKVTTDGIINTVAGGGPSQPGDGGPAISANLMNPVDVAVDAAGNLYIADEYAGRLRKVTAATGVISTYAGNGIIGSSGDGLPATRAEIYPESVAVDSKGIVYFANRLYTVRMVDPASQVVSTVAGSGYAGFSGDGGSATMATTFLPISVATDKADTLYFADEFNGRIRKVTFSASSTLTQAATPTFSPAPGAYASPQAVSIADATPGAKIYYTTDGTTPTGASASYLAPVTISTSGTVKAIAMAAGYATSPVASGTYVIGASGNPAPSLSGLSPAVKTAGSAAFILTVTGSGFVSTSTVYWGNTQLSTQYVDGGTLTAQVTSSDIATAGTSSVTVQSPLPGGGTSNSLKFQVDTAGSTPPSFGTTTATVTAGSSATYAANLTSSASSVSVQCLNLPSGTSCSYSPSTGMLTVATSSTTPKGTYQFIVVFTETLPGGAAWLLPVLLLPLAAVKQRKRTRTIWLVIVAGLAIASASTGCGGGGGGSTTTPPPATHQATSSAAINLVVQ